VSLIILIPVAFVPLIVEGQREKNVRAIQLKPFVAHLPEYLALADASLPEVHEPHITQHVITLDSDSRRIDEGMFFSWRSSLDFHAPTTD